MQLYCAGMVFIVCSSNRERFADSDIMSGVLNVMLRHGQQNRWFVAIID